MKNTVVVNLLIHLSGATVSGIVPRFHQLGAQAVLLWDLTQSDRRVLRRFRTMWNAKNATCVTSEYIP